MTETSRLETTHLAETRERLGKVGVWILNAVTATAPAAVQRREVARIERLGYGSVWTGESYGRDIFALLGIWLAATERIVVGSGVANLWSRPGSTMRAGADTLAEAYPGRFALGIGHGYVTRPTVGGRDFSRPLARSREYLDEMDSAPLERGDSGAIVRATWPRLLGANGPRMTALAGERADGTLPFAGPVAATRRAREILGPGKLVIPEQHVVVDTDPARARETAFAARAAALAAAQRAGVDPLDSPYNRQLLRLGYGEKEIRESSPRVIDAIIAYGDGDAIAARIHEHLDAGADHVLLYIQGAADMTTTVDRLEAIAARMPF
ncbi:TIGR03620 family F420-dependent LLM class oxidoreductase [Nocardia sp. BMG111209]|uniref:TIGR03620 family F420-dependent LLM class oxidoreductase n=1 Tax=Nocardia sp. BMG111209 TaxID=1160137 RepID=UPI00036B161B|nr:TIGR03620 family F420-dependent LLM class oxidoreductase [Nocardia sp. BMG111209]